MFKKNLLLISILILLLLPSFAFAIDIPGWPIVPCGISSDNPATTEINEAKTCSRCDLFKLLKNIIDFTIGGLMPPLAILFFVWAGFLILLGGANPGLVSQGKTIFTNTFYGIIIILSAWMITNTVLQSVGSNYNNSQNWWQFTCVESAPVQPPTVFAITTASLPGGVVGQPYNQTIQTTGGTPPLAWTQLGSLPAGLSFNTATGVISGTPTTAGASTFTIRVTDQSDPSKSAEQGFTVTITEEVSVCNDPQALAQQNNTAYPAKRAPELDGLLSCISNTLGQSLPTEGGSNSYFGSIFTYENSNELCNYTRNSGQCNLTCQHARNSCHYGGSSGSQGALAVDFGNESNGDAIIGAAQNCGVPSTKTRCENAAGVRVSCTGAGATHAHISAAGCDAN